ncbi:hypothetical protein GWI33_004022, partial [Rhynchophorus ferrugineus]
WNSNASWLEEERTRCHDYEEMATVSIITDTLKNILKSFITGNIPDPMAYKISAEVDIII